jgi:hypothetical protein
MPVVSIPVLTKGLSRAWSFPHEVISTSRTDFLLADNYVQLVQFENVICGIVLTNLKSGLLVFKDEQVQSEFAACLRVSKETMYLTN